MAQKKEEKKWYIGDRPSLEDYLERRAMQVSDSAATAILGQQLPNIPKVPAYKGLLGQVSRGAGFIGIPDDSRISLFGYEPDPWTCLWTATSQYGDKDAKVAGNLTLKNNPEQYGFTNIPMSEARRGDLLQFTPEDTPEHSAIYTGEREEHVPLVSYSRGGTGATTITPEGEKPTMAHNINIQEVVNREGEPSAYRYIGSKGKRREWTSEYYDKYGNPKKVSPNLPLFDFRETEYKFPMEHSKGGFLQPKDAWDKLSLSQKADMMKVAVRNGITNLQDIRKRYNEFAEGGAFNSLPDNWTMEDESAYRQWLSSLPDNLKSTDDSVYDMRRAFKAGMVPVLNKDGYYHLGSRDPQTGRILKAPTHPTYLQAIVEDARMGYYPTVDDKGVTYTNTWKGNIYKGGGSVVDDSLIDLIIKEEGFNEKPEDIGDGKITLGSGLTNSRWHDLYKRRGNVWSETDNRNAVRTEAVEREQWAKANIPNWKNLSDSAKKALLLYKYNFDFTRNNSPKLFAALEAGNLQEAAKQMDATSKDPKFQKGLADRRRREQALFLSDVPITGIAPTDITTQHSDNAVVFNPYTLQQQNTIPLPQYVPVENEYVRTVEVSPEQQRAIQLQKRFDQINRFNQLMKLAGIENTAVPAFMPETRVTMLDDIWDNGEYAKGGKIYIKPSHRGRLTELKKRTGKTEAELYNDGNPAHKRMVVFARNSRKWKHGLGGNLYGGGGGGLTNIILGPRPGVTDNEDVRGILSWLPYTSTAIDIDNASKDPSAANLTWAGVSTGLDLLSFGLASKIKRGIKAVEKAIESVEKAATSATKRAERAKKVYEQAPSHKNYELNLKAQREAFEKNYVLNNQVDGLYKQLADEQWYESTWLPIMDGHGGIVSQGAQTIFEGVNTPQKALGGNLFLTGGDSEDDNEPGILTKGALWLGKKLGIADVFKGKADDAQYRQSIYNGVDPTDAIPNQFGKALQYAGVATRANMGTKFAKNRHHSDPAADAAWAKRLGLPYDKNILIDNGDGSVRLSDSLEAQIPVDTVFLKQRIADNKARLNKVSGPARQHTQYALDYDRDALEALRKTYATGEPVEMNEGSAVGRNWRTNDPERLISPLNLFHRYTVQYDKDKNAINYWDWYDFNNFENFVPGDPFKIKGSINLKKKRKK